jgi:hypothetical protein
MFSLSSRLVKRRGSTLLILKGSMMVFIEEFPRFSRIPHMYGEKLQSLQECRLNMPERIKSRLKPGGYLVKRGARAGQPFCNADFNSSSCFGRQGEIFNTLVMPLF